MTLNDHFNFLRPTLVGGAKLRGTPAEHASATADEFLQTLLEVGTQSENHRTLNFVGFSLPDRTSVPEAAAEGTKAFMPFEEVEGLEAGSTIALSDALASTIPPSPPLFTSGWVPEQNRQQEGFSANPTLGTSGTEIALLRADRIGTDLVTRAVTGLPLGKGDLPDSVRNLETVKELSEPEHSDAGNIGPKDSAQASASGIASFPVRLNPFASVPGALQPTGSAIHIAPTAGPHTPLSGHSIVDGLSKPTETLLLKPPSAETRPDRPVNQGTAVRPTVGAEALSLAPTEDGLEPQIEPATATKAPQRPSVQPQLDRQEPTVLVTQRGLQTAVQDAPMQNGLAMMTDPVGYAMQSSRTEQLSIDPSSGEISAETEPPRRSSAEAPMLASVPSEKPMANQVSDNIEPNQQALDGLAEGRAPVEQYKPGHSFPEPGRNALRLDDHAPRTIEVIVTAARALGDRPVELTLNPEELGRVRMTLRASDDGMTVQLAVERPETLDLLRRSIDLLANDLRQAGYDRLSFGFAGDSRSQGNPMQHHSEPLTVTPGTAETDLDPLLPISLALSSDGLDLRI